MTETETPARQWLTWRKIACVAALLLLAGYIAARPTLEKVFGINLPAVIEREKEADKKDDNRVVDSDNDNREKVKEKKTEKKSSNHPNKPADKNGTSKSEPVFRRISIGNGRFKTPQGLLYSRGQVAHVMRHARNIPDRKSPHGVFDVKSEDEVLALIDRAYAKTKSKSKDVKHKRERADRGDMRDVYSIDMKKRIGWVGGMIKHKPPCNYLKLVVQDKSVITAYPTNRR